MLFVDTLTENEYSFSIDIYYTPLYDNFDDHVNEVLFYQSSNADSDIIDIFTIPKNNNDNSLKSKSPTEIIEKNNNFLSDINVHTINKSENASSNNSKNSTENSSNCNNNICEHSVLYNKSAKFKVLKSLNIPEKFKEINIDLDMSCDNLYYYKKKKNKIIEKIKKDYDVKTVKMEDYEKPLIREFKRFIKANKDKYKNYLNEDEIFWELFLSNKYENYTAEEKEYKKLKFQKYNQKLIHYLFRRKDIKDLYNNEFKEHCKHKKIKTKRKNDEIIYHFYSQYFDVLYNEEIHDINFDTSRI